MSKLLLMSILFGIVLIPVWAARQPHPIRGFRQLLLGLVVLHLGYTFLVKVVLPRLS